MLSFIYKYLILHDHVGIPGIGSFTVERSAATIRTNGIDPGQSEIVFTPGTALTEKKFYRFLSDETGLSEVDSVRKFQDFAYQLRKDIQSNASVTLNGLGVLKQVPAGSIEFEPHLSIDRYFSPVTVEPLEKPAQDGSESSDIAEAHGIEVYDEDEPIKKETWWIWALVLGLLALAAIVYFYMQGEII